MIKYKTHHFFQNMQPDRRNQYANFISRYLCILENTFSRSTTIQAAIFYYMAKRYASRGATDIALDLFSLASIRQPSWGLLTRERLELKESTYPHLLIEDREKFQMIRSFCGFIGYPRSGHSLVGALVDAHPNACISHEADIFQFFSDIQKGPELDKITLIRIIAENVDLYFKYGRAWQGHDYDLSRERLSDKRLFVVGDKKGNGTLRHWVQNPNLFETFRQIWDEDIKLIHVYRNPFDNISRIFH